MSENIKIERILCAAVWYNDNVTAHIHKPINVKSGYVVAGRRHYNCIQMHVFLTGSWDNAGLDVVQGFLTSGNRFVNRMEAGQIAFEAGQIKELTDCLISEDLY